MSTKQNETPAQQIVRSAQLLAQVADGIQGIVWDGFAQQAKAMASEDYKPGEILAGAQAAATQVEGAGIRHMLAVSRFVQAWLIQIGD